MNDILVVEDIHTYYGESYILQGLSLRVGSSSVVSIVGRNGMGKTTAMRSVVGFTPPRRGKVWFQGHQITGLTAFEIARKGLALVPQGRRIFPSLTVRENLAIAAREPRQKGRVGYNTSARPFSCSWKEIGQQGKSVERRRTADARDRAGLDFQPRA